MWTEAKYYLLSPSESPTQSSLSETITSTSLGASRINGVAVSSSSNISSSVWSLVLGRNNRMSYVWNKILSKPPKNPNSNWL